MVVTQKLARFADARNTAEGKLVSVLLSLLLVFSFLNVTMFADRANAEEDAEVELVLKEANDQPAPVAEEPKVEAPAEEPTLEGDPEPTNPEPNQDPEDPEGDTPAPAIDPEDEGEEPEGATETEQPEASGNQTKPNTAKSARQRSANGGVQTLDASQQTDSITRVYVYVQVNGDTAGWSMNIHGWYTIGYIEVPGNVLKKATSTNEWSNVDVLPYFDTMVRHDTNKDMEFDFNKVEWTGDGYGLHSSNGATDYPDYSAAWHLDGSYTVTEEETYSLTVNYEYDDDCAASGDKSKLPGTYAENELRPGHVYEIQSRKIDGYVASPETVKGSIVNKDVETTVVYHRDANGNNTPDCEEEKFTVTYQPGDHGTFDEKSYEGILPGLPTPEFEGETTAEDGWKFAGWSPAITDTVTKSENYVAQWEQIKFTVTYNLKGGSINGDNSAVVYKEQAKNAPTPKPADPKRFGYTFTGWTPEVAETVTKDATYEAQWEAIAYTLTISANSNTVTYDGEYHGAAGLANVAAVPNSNGMFAVKVTDKDKVFYVAGFGAKINSEQANDDGKVQNVGEYELLPYPVGTVVVYDENGRVFDNGAITVNVEPGKLVIEPAPGNTIDVEGLTDENGVAAAGFVRLYDGTSYTLAAKATKGRSTLQYSVDGAEWTDVAPSFTNAGVYAVRVRATNPNYATVETAATVNIKKRTVVIESASDRKDYDGERFSRPSVKVTGDGFAEGEGATTSFSEDCYIVEPGYIYNTFDYQLNEDTKASNYDVFIRYGMLVIDKASGNTVGIEGLTDENGVAASGFVRLYDGTSYTLAAKATKGRSTLHYSVDGAEWTDVAPSFTNAGVYAVRVRATNPNYTDTETVEATVVIKKRNVVIESVGARKDFDGVALRRPSVKVTGDGFAEGEGATTSFSEDCYIVEPGYIYNTFDYQLNEDTKASNYDVFIRYGMLIVDPGKDNTVTITGLTGENGVAAEGLEVTYDGTAYTVAATAQKIGSEILYSEDGETWSKNAPSYTDAGNYNVFVRATNKNYIDTPVVSATVVINKRSVTVSGNKTVEYNGREQRMYGTNHKADGLVKSHGYRLTKSVAGTEKGTYAASEATDVIFFDKNNNDVTANYAPTVNVVLEITAKPITFDPFGEDETAFVVNGLEDKVYNGEQQQLKPIVIDNATQATLVEGTDYDVYYERGTEVTDDFTNVGTISVVIAGKGNYEGKVARTYKITPFPVVVKANDAAKIYGQADPELTATVGQKPNDGIAIKYDVARAGGEVVAEYTILPYGDKDQGNGNYAVTYESGIFTISPAGSNVVTVNNLAGANGLVKTYDGRPASVVARAAVIGSTFQYSLDGRLWTSQNPSFTNAGTYTVYVRANAANYETTPVVSATVTINPRPVTITVNNASKTRGQADPVFTGAITAGSLVNAGDLGAITYSRTNRTNRVGVYPGVLTANFADNDNYTITVVRGDFTVLPAVVPSGTDDPTPAATTPTPTPATTPGNNTPTTVVTGNDNPTTVITDDDTPMAEAPTTDETPLTEAGDAETIDENETPMAARATIPDEDVPLGAFEPEDVDCWVHWIMILGLVATAIYGIAVARRRLGFIDDLDDYEDQIMGRRTEERAAHAPADGRQAL